MHQKHSNLHKPLLGQFGRTEFALLGTNCGAIQQFATQLIEQLHTDYELLYVDADHQAADTNSKKPLASYLTDKITNQRIDFRTLNPFQQKNITQGADIMLVNGNHFEAQQQIIFLDAKKENSLRKRLHQLTAVKAFIKTDENVVIFDFLKENLPNWHAIPVLALQEIEKAVTIIKENIQPTPLHGLVLAGGKSQRMGQDKTLLDYHGKPQRQHALDLLKPVCKEAFLSCRTGEIGEGIIADTFLDLGPYGGILSAFRQNPNAAWFTIAADMPLLDAETIALLVTNRNLRKMATTFLNPETNFPEPLLTIWEPKAYPVLLQFLALGYSCPRKVLINSDIELVHLPKSETIRNVNTPAERDEVMTKTRRFAR